MNNAFWWSSKILALIWCAIQCGAPAALADSLWKAEGATTMFADKRAAAVGDILTIIVQESSVTSKDASTKSSKSTSADMSISTALYGASTVGSATGSGFLKSNGYPAVKYSTKNDFDGSGSVGSTERIVSRIAVRVVDVLPNRCLLIEGSRRTSFSGETQDVTLRGLVRYEDIMANNTVYSYNLADVSIKFAAKGSVTDSQSKGWFTKVFDKINPF